MSEVHRLSVLIDYVVVNPGGKRRQVMDERELLVKHGELTEASHSHPSRRCSNFTEGAKVWHLKSRVKKKVDIFCSPHTPRR